ncbi:MAG: two-component system response regulator NreC [Verrucomicrobiales bacterium]
MLLEAISEILAGNLWVSKDVTRFLLGNGKHGSNGMNGTSPQTNGDGKHELGIDSLSNRELQVFRLTGEGLPTRVIAEAMTINPRTVESHKEHIKVKLSLKTGTELTTKATLWLQGQL